MEEAFDPNSNADYAARLLLGLYHGEAAGSWDLAVGLYHSHTSSVAMEFRHRVAFFGGHVMHAPLKRSRVTAQRLSKRTRTVAEQ